MTFNLVNVKIVKALNDIGITEPMLIQEKAIPPIMEGKDVIGISKTGSGKTAAFGIPLLERLKIGAGLQVLIIVPTRELAVQIAGELEKFGKYLDCKTTTIFGGVAIDPQIQKLRTADVVVGTPGRLIDHLQRRTIDLSKIRAVVLDEADKMVEMGFVEDITRLLDYTPNDRQILLFGATISSEINKIKAKYMKDPFVARAEVHVKEDFLEQYYYNIGASKKFSFLVHLLQKEDTDRAIIFCSTRATVEIVSQNLKAQGITVAMIHGKLSQNRRMKVMENFNNGNPNILVASAVAARGLDIKFVSHVINYDLSGDPQEYVHRVGRTARAGESGKAITLLSKRDHDSFREILHRYNLDVKELPLEKFDKVPFNTRIPQQKSRYGNRRRQYGRRRTPNQYIRSY